MNRYYLARDKKTGYAVGVLKTSNSIVFGTSGLLMIKFEIITKAEYETYIEFDMYVISPNDTFGKLADLAKEI